MLEHLLYFCILLRISFVCCTADIIVVLLPILLQIHCLQFLICELVSGGNLRKPGGLFGNSGSGIPVEDLKQLETFFYKLSFFLHILDYTGAYLIWVNLKDSNSHALKSSVVTFHMFHILIKATYSTNLHFTTLNFRNSYLLFVYPVALECTINCYPFLVYMQRLLVR
jgi:hypothetical protein